MSNDKLSEIEKSEIIRGFFDFLLKVQDRHLDTDYSDYPILRLLEKEMGLNVQPCISEMRNSEENQLNKAIKNHHDKDFENLKFLVEASALYHEQKLPKGAFCGSFLNALSLAQIDATKIIIARKQGNNPPIPEQYRIDKPFNEQHRNVTPTEFEKTTSVSLTKVTKVIEEYSKDRLAIGKWTDKTREENHALYNNFLEFAGKDIRCADINYHLISEFRDALKRLPANRKKSKKYRRKTIAQIMKMDVPNPMSITTVNKNLNRLSTILNFAVKLGYMPTNPAEGMEIPITEKDSEQRNIFDNSDLQKLFNSEQYYNDSFLHPFMFWACPIALFTGMRQTEIAQLHLFDIYEKDSIWVVNVNDNAKDKKVKNRNARRLIPLHSFLVNTLNLPRYVKHLKEQGHKRLFPEINYHRDGYGQAVSRWFNGHGDGVTTGYKKNCGITDGKKVFHSFRHTVINHLKQKQVDGTLLHEFDGHSLGTMTYDRYGKAFTPELMYEKIVSQITFDKELDLAHLMKSKYVID
ncbi:site-specific integrase [Pseudodesulfovibrio alkaliphilus]|nr:site-specific integrase [Pseudodesulfovibrio alkaliphilus]